MCSGLFHKVLATLQIITLLPLLAHAGISKCGKWPYSYAGEMTPGGLSPQDLSDFDFVVIGGGLSGSIISKRLSENDRWKILVLEAGGNFGRKPNKRAFLHADQTWTTAFYRHSISWRRGAYNLGPMRWVYGLPEDYDTWLDMGNEDWGWDDVEPYFELTTKQSDDVATIQGYMELSEIGSRNYDHALADIQRIIFEAYKEELASKDKAVNPERTVRDYEVKYATPKVGVHRCNVRVIKFAEVVSINLDESGKSVNSVTFVLRGNRTLEAKFRKELILAAGPIDSAKLLMLSGIGPASHLTSLGITVKHDLPVGLGLEDHHYVPLLFEVPDLPYEFPRVLQNVKLTTLYERDLFGYQGEHIFSTFYGVNLTGSPSLNDGTVELQYFYITRNDSLSLKEWRSHFRLSAKYEDILTGLGVNKNLLIVHVVLSHPVSKGIVELSSKNYMDTPMVSTNYLQNSDDLRTIVSGMRFVYEMVNTASFKEKGVKYLHNIVPVCGYNENSDAEWECIAGYYLASQYDHAGTVKMGPMGHGGCVDNHLRLRGVDNLRVIGSSVIPRLPSGEVGASAAMIAERAADFIRVRWGGRPRYM